MSVKYFVYNIFLFRNKKQNCNIEDVFNNTSNNGTGIYMSTYFHLLSSDFFTIFSVNRVFISSSYPFELKECMYFSSFVSVKTIFRCSLFHILQMVEVQDKHFTGRIDLPIMRFIKLLFPADVSP